MCSITTLHTLFAIFIPLRDKIDITLNTCSEYLVFCIAFDTADAYNTGGGLGVRLAESLQLYHLPASVCDGVTVDL